MTSCFEKDLFSWLLEHVPAGTRPTMTLCRYRCDVRSRRIDVNTTSFLRHVPAGVSRKLFSLYIYTSFHFVLRVGYGI